MGYKSGSNSSITTTETSIACVGSFACRNSLLSAGDVSFGGSQSGYNALIKTDTSVYCHGSNSCSFATISEGTSCYCNGDASCGFSIISGIECIYGYGAFSLKNATIDNTNIDGTNMNIYFYGYNSGYGAKIHCESNNSCSVYCRGFACRGMECFGCNIIHYEYVIDTPIPYYNSLDWGTNNDIQCIQGDAMSHDGGSGYQNGDDLSLRTSNVSTLCCRGEDSCKEVNNIEYYGSGNVVCSGQQSCQQTGNINNYDGDVFCEGQNACSGSQITTASAVYCFGMESCQFTTITATHIICSGHESCRQTHIISPGNGNNDTVTIYVLGFMAQSNTIIDCQEGDVCDVFMIPDPLSTDNTSQCDGERIVTENVYTQSLLCPTVNLNVSIYTADITEQSILDLLEQTASSFVAVLGEDAYYNMESRVIEQSETIRIIEAVLDIFYYSDNVTNDALDQQYLQTSFEDDLEDEFQANVNLYSLFVTYNAYCDEITNSSWEWDTATTTTKFTLSTTGAVIIILLITFFTTYVYQKHYRKNDDFNWIPFGECLWEIFHIVSDIMFIITVAYAPEVMFPLFITTIVLFVVPGIISIVLLRIKIDTLSPDRTGLLYLISIASGNAFTAVRFGCSGLLCIGVDKNHSTAFQLHRLWCIVLLQNIPQIAVEFIFLEMKENGSINDFQSLIALAVSWTFIFQILGDIWSCISERKEHAAETKGSTNQTSGEMKCTSAEVEMPTHGDSGENEIVNWLKAIGQNFYDEYYSLFMDNGFDSLDVVKTMTDDDFISIGIEKLGHRRVLNIEIQKMNAVTIC